MKRTMSFLEGFLLGGMVGLAVTLLVAPASGDELRGRVQGEVQRVRSEVSRAAQVRRAELEQQLKALRMPQKM